MVGHRLSARSGGIVLVVGALALLGACSSDDGDRLDRASTEQAIERVIEADLPQEVGAVTCPARIPRGRGRTVRCAVTLRGVKGKVGLEATQGADDELDVRLLDAVIDPSEVADELEQQLLATYLRTFTADCGTSGTRALAPGSTVPCTVADDAGSREATATVADSSGTLRFSVADPPDEPEPTDEPGQPDEPAVPGATFAPGPAPTSVPTTGAPATGN